MPTKHTADFYVEDASESIQDAIDAATNWDVIFLGDDVWANEELDFGGKSIWLIGTAGSTVRGAGTLVTTAGSSESQARLRISRVTFEGFGSTQQSRAVFVRYTDLEMIDCVIQEFDPRPMGNATALNGSANGGGILSLESEVLLRRIEITSCSADKGGGICHDTASTTNSSLPIQVEDCVFTNCEANLQGGGLKINATLTMDNTMISSCEARCGGGLYVTSKNNTSVIQFTRFYHNACLTSYDYGTSGAMCGLGYIMLSHCQFHGNQADKFAACSLTTLFDQDEDILLQGCVFTDSYSEAGGWDFNFEGISTHTGDVAMRRVRVAMQSPPIEYWHGSGANAGKVYVNDGGVMRDVTGMYIGDGGACPFDLNQDGSVAINELLDLFAHWGDESLINDWDGDRQLTSEDLALMLSHWGDCLPDA